MVTSQPPPRVRPCGTVTTGTAQYSSRFVAAWNWRTMASMSSQFPSCASINSSIRLAPALKFSPRLATTSACPWVSASLQAVMIIEMVS